MSEGFLGCTFVKADGSWCGLAADDVGLCVEHAGLRCRCGEQAIRTCPDCHALMCLPCWKIRPAHKCPVVTSDDRRRERIKDAIRAFGAKKSGQRF